MKYTAGVKSDGLIEGKVIDIFTDEEGQWVKVKYGRNIKEMPPNDEHLRTIDSEGNKLKWHNVVEAVKQELYPLIATSLGEAVEELIESNTLKPHNLSDTATDLVIDNINISSTTYCRFIEFHDLRRELWQQTDYMLFHEASC